MKNEKEKIKVFVKGKRGEVVLMEIEFLESLGYEVILVDEYEYKFGKEVENV